MEISMSAVEKLFEQGEGAEVVNVTPDIARHLIETSNRENRKVKPNVVKRYARLMAEGDWRFSPETISISKTGRLLNGQHRMLAVIESGVTCRFLFATGFDDEIFGVLDRGAVRTRADALKIDRKLSDTASLVCRLASSDPGSINDADVYRAAKSIEQVHGDLLEFCNTSARCFSSVPFRLAAVCRVKAGADQDYVFDLYRNLVLSRTEVLPPIGHAVVRAVLTGRMFAAGGHVQPTNACAAWDIFNPTSAYKSKLTIKYKPQVAREIVKAANIQDHVQEAGRTAFTFDAKSALEAAKKRND